ncbi:hypothetical protein D9M68_974940 [compost metagenome]
MGIAATAVRRRAMASFTSTLFATFARQSTRRNGSWLKFWMLSENTLLLPTMVVTLSGVRMVVANRPSSFTVPVVPPAQMKSPTL